MVAVVVVCERFARSTTQACGVVGGGGASGHLRGCDIVAENGHLSLVSKVLLLVT